MHLSIKQLLLLLMPHTQQIATTIEGRHQRACMSVISLHPCRHLLTFLQLRQPGYFFRGMVLLAQG